MGTPVDNGLRRMPPPCSHRHSLSSTDIFFLGGILPPLP
jgi:hypothetical protein